MPFICHAIFFNDHKEFVCCKLFYIVGLFVRCLHNDILSPNRHCYLFDQLRCNTMNGANKYEYTNIYIRYSIVTFPTEFNDKNDCLSYII